jgi:hypothetical protein
MILVVAGSKQYHTVSRLCHNVVEKQKGYQPLLGDTKHMC